MNAIVRVSLIAVVLVALMFSPAWGQVPAEALLWTFECDTEGWLSWKEVSLLHAYVESEGGLGALRLTYGGKVNDPVIVSPRGLSVSHTANRYLAFSLFASGIPENTNLPGAFACYTSTDTLLEFVSFTWRVINGKALVRIDLNSRANWGSSVDVIRLDLPEGDASGLGFDYSNAVVNIDWVAATDNPNFVPPDQQINAPCARVMLPSVVGVTEAGAISMIEAAGFVSSVRYQQGSGAPNGVVLSQEPVGGMTLAQGDGVVLTVSQQYQQYRVAEFSFEADSIAGLSNPAKDVTFGATFSGPGGAAYDIPGFWDGGHTWRLRFNPVLPGTWSYTTTVSPAISGLQGQSDTFEAVPASGDNRLHRHGGILAVSDDGHHLTHTDGTPFYWLGDTWWYCPSELVPFVGGTNPAIKSAFKYLADYRGNQGFTVIQMASIGPAILGQFDVIWPDFWKQYDLYIEYANAKGLVPALALAFSSMYDYGTLDEWEFIWRYVVARYGAYGVSWLISGEYDADNGQLAERIPKMLALGQYIKDVDPYKRAMSIHPWAHWLETRESWSQPWLDFIMFQGAHGTPPDNGIPPASLYYDAYSLSPARPVVEGECVYEGILDLPLSTTRAAAYNAVQSGAFGYTYGANGLWYPTQDENDTTFTDPWGVMPPWWEAVQRPGGAQMGFMRNIYESVEWWTLEPRPGKATRSEAQVKGAADTTFAIYFADGLDAAAEVSLTSLTEGVVYRGHWRDPRTGEKTLLGGDISVSGGSLLLPVRPSSGDWMLILRNASAPVEVPDVTGLPDSEARLRLEARGFTVNVVPAYDPAIPLGDVISQSIAGGDSATLGATVEYVVSLGAAPTITASVPNGWLEEGMALTLTAPEGVSYQWYYNGSPLANQPGLVSGVDERQLLFSSVLQSDAGSYTCIYSVDAVKVEFETPPYQLEVLPAGSLPGVETAGLAFLIVAVLAVGARRSQSRNVASPWHKSE